MPTLNKVTRAISNDLVQLVILVVKTLSYEINLILSLYDGFHVVKYFFVFMMYELSLIYLSYISASYVPLRHLSLSL